MHHYTFNTGHSRVSPRSEVGDSVIAILKPIAAGGHHRIPAFDYLSVIVTIKEGQAIFSILADRKPKPMPVIHGGVAWTAAGRTILERELEKINAAGGARIVPDHQTAEKSPEGVPWCGIVMFDSVALLGEDIAAIADFERCLAWAIIDRYANLQNSKA